MQKNGIEYVSASGDDAAEVSPAIKPPRAGVFQRLKAMMAQDERDQALAELSENQALQAENEGLITQIATQSAQIADITRQLSAAQTQIADLKGQIEKLDALKSKETVNVAAARIAAENHVDLAKLPGSAGGEGESEMEKLMTAFSTAPADSYEKARIAKQIRELSKRKK